jgi:hypothetical protein
MAIVINTEPANTVSVNNEMLFVVYEATKAIDPVTYPDYSYVCDVYVSSTLVGRIISRPDPEYNRGIFDVAPILRSYVTYGLDASADVVDYTAKIAYQLKFGEQYDGTLYTNLLVDSSDREAYKTYAPKPFTSTSVLSNGLVSNMPSTVNYHRTQLYHLIPIFSNVTGITDLVVTFKDSGGSTISTDTTSNAGYVAKMIRQINIGEQALDIPSTAEYSLITGAGVSLRVNYLCDGKYTPYTLVWLNPFGAYESQSFGMVSKKVIELEKKDFSQLDYRINASGEVSYQANNVFYGGKRGYAARVKVKLNLTSHLINASEYAWLADLFISPDVYLYDTETSKFIPVTIGRNNYEYRTYANSRLTPLQFEVEFSTTYNSQFL